jgi:effector-binding domain-containing protein
MIETPQILQTEAQPAAVIPLTIPRADMMAAFGPAITELLAELAVQGVTPLGAAFAHHLKMSPGIFDFELGFLVGKPVKAAGRMKPGELPARRVARTMYLGPYEGLPDAWGEFSAWMDKQGLRQADDLWEHYVYGPQSHPDAKTWKTELTRPLAG